MSAVKINRIGKFDLNPRGNLWLKDENRFGHKLLTKLGWSDGKGLGKEENGIKENLKVRMKCGNTGVGWTQKMPFGVKTHEYDAVLEKLNKKFQTSDVVASTKNIKDEENTKSLEQRSQQFKNRLHYRKFVRGKDVGRYSEKEMAAIFVKKKVQPIEETSCVKSSVTNINTSSEENSEPESLPTFKSCLDMKDYFAMKMSKKCNGELPKTTQEIVDDPIKEADTVEEEVFSRKRKRGSKKCKKSKKIKYEEEDTSDNATLLQGERDDDAQLEESYNNTVEDEQCNKQQCNIEEQCHEDVERPGHKKKKSMKSKSSKVEKLKSCLKRTAIMWFKADKKEVSFNDSISVKLINNRYDEEEAELSLSEEESQTEEPHSRVGDSNKNGERTQGDDFNDTDISYLSEESESTHFEKYESGFSRVKKYELEDSSSEINQSKDIPKNETVTEEASCDDSVFEMPKCFDLPNSSNSNYTTWIETQRIAKKMSLYRTLVQNIRRDQVLRTTNLLDIKGYGNWGF